MITSYSLGVLVLKYSRGPGGTGAVYAWGGGKEGQIGDGATESRLTPVKVASGATGISATADDVVIK
jgi:alpha-tubulin suppressor-like RCC1 family protein